MDIVKKNREAWDILAQNNDKWTQPVPTEEVERARSGQFSIVLTPEKSIPMDWFPKKLSGKKILCLASGGGQQGPILAAAGADVTVFDNSTKQLEQDLFVAERDNLRLETVQGDMKDLSDFQDESFDMIVHPWSNCFVDDILPVWKECYRVLKFGGTLVSGFSNSFEYIFDYKELEKGQFIAKYKLPYSDVKSLNKEELEDVYSSNEPLVFGHTLSDQIKGQTDAGFLIEDFYEDIGGNTLDAYTNGSIATKSIKLRR